MSPRRALSFRPVLPAFLLLGPAAAAAHACGPVSMTASIAGMEFMAGYAYWICLVGVSALAALWNRKSTGRLRAGMLSRATVLHASLLVPLGIAMLCMLAMGSLDGPGLVVCALWPVVPVLYWRRRVRNSPALRRHLASPWIAAPAIFGIAGLAPMVALGPQSSLAPIFAATLAAFYLSPIVSALAMARAEVMLRRAMTAPVPALPGGGPLQMRPIGAVCRVCGDTVGGRPMVCTDCMSPHHAECWEYTGGCATYGCGSESARLHGEAP